jgi:hypothetical protein
MKYYDNISEQIREKIMTWNYSIRFVYTVPIKV